MTRAGRYWFAWAGLVLAPLAWASFHQAGSSWNFADCSSSSSGVLIIGFVSLAVALGSGALSIAGFRAGSALEVHRFIAIMSLMAAGLFAIAIAFQILAGLTLPPCVR